MWNLNLTFSGGASSEGGLASGCRRSGRSAANQGCYEYSREFGNGEIRFSCWNQNFQFITFCIELFSLLFPLFSTNQSLAFRERIGSRTICLTVWFRWAVERWISNMGNLELTKYTVLRDDIPTIGMNFSNKMSSILGQIPGRITLSLRSGYCMFLSTLCLIVPKSSRRILNENLLLF